MKLLYHGTDSKFLDYDYSLAKPNKDFGKGFYLTSNIEQATMWAKRKNHDNYYVMVYDVDEAVLNNLSIYELLDYNKEWLDFIVDCRINSVEKNDCDLILDRIADSVRGKEIADLLEAYLHRVYSADYVLNKIKWTAKNDQWCFKTQKSITALHLKENLNFHKNIKGEWVYENVFEA